MKTFSMSQYLNKEELYRDKAEYWEWVAGYLAVELVKKGGYEDQPERFLFEADSSYQQKQKAEEVFKKGLWETYEEMNKGEQK